ncbi:MAG TPA: hypothetical protein PKV66_06100 [Candidatus Pelethenecus sp.]|nr:hypothetical protein [Candidatus Pelethenecus sp.]
MEEQTTTNSVAQEATGVQHVNGVAIDDQGMAIAASDDGTQPEAATEEAGSHTEESDSANDSGEVDNTSQSNTSSQPVDDELTKWAQAKGLEQLSSDSEIKLAKMARESEKAMHSAKGEAKSVLQEEAMKTNEMADPLAEKIASLEAKVAISDFYNANPDARAYDEKMGEALANDPALLEYVRSTGNISAVYGIVKSADTAKDAESFKKEGGREALTQLASKQQAAAVKGSAVNSAPSSSEKITPQNVDELIGKNGQQWYMAHRDEINKVLDPSYKVN